MLPTDGSIRDSRDGQTPSYEVAIADLRRTLAATRDAPDRNAQVLRMVESLARAAKGRGVKPEVVVVLFRNAWEEEVPAALRISSDGADLQRHRAIGSLLRAYYEDS